VLHITGAKFLWAPVNALSAGSVSSCDWYESSFRLCDKSGLENRHRNCLPNRRSLYRYRKGVCNDLSIDVVSLVMQRLRVLRPDGTPAIGADVYAYDLKYLYSGDPPRANAHAQGRATLSLYEGRTYYLVSTISGGTQQRCAGPLKFVAREGVTLGAITIEHNWGNCLAQLNSEFQPPR